MARMVAGLDAEAMLCAPFGGETGTVLRALLAGEELLVEPCEARAETGDLRTNPRVRHRRRPDHRNRTHGPLSTRRRAPANRRRFHRPSPVRRREGAQAVAHNTERLVIRADFDDPSEAQGAMFDLEGAGIDAADINLVNHAPVVPTRETQLAADAQLVKGVATRYGKGAAIGAIIGAAIALAIVAAVGIEPRGAAMLMAGVAGGTAGFFYGGFLGVARHLPVNEDTFDVAMTDPRDPEPLHVEVRVEDDGVAARAEKIMRSHAARTIRRKHGGGQ